MSAAEAEPQAPAGLRSDEDSPARRYAMLGLLAGAQMAASFGTIGLPSLAPLLREDLGLSVAQAGSVLSAFYLGRFIVSLPAGWLTDRLGARTTWLAGQGLTAAFLLVTARTGTFLSLLLALAGVGLGFGSANPPSQRAVMEWFPRASRATAVGIRQTGAPLGGALGALILPSLALASGWRAAVATAGALMLAMFVVSALGYRRPRRSALAADETQAQASPADAPAARTARGLVALMACITGLFSCVQLSWTSYLTLYLHDALGYSVRAAGAVLAQGNIGGIAGTILLGLLSDRAFGGRRKPVLIGCAVVVAGLLVVQARGAALPGWVLLAVVLALGGLAIGWDGVHFALLGELAPRGRTGLALGVGHLGSTSGAVLGPPLFGAILAWTGSFTAAWLFAAGVSLANAAALNLLPESRRRR
ncbi:MAG TPA: MFS transporter [Candidatus Methylomirabilis sp.]